MSRLTIASAIFAGTLAGQAAAQGTPQLVNENRVETCMKETVTQVFALQQRREFNEAEVKSSSAPPPNITDFLYRADFADPDAAEYLQVITHLEGYNTRQRSGHDSVGFTVQYNNAQTETSLAAVFDITFDEDAAYNSAGNTPLLEDIRILDYSQSNFNVTGDLEPEHIQIRDAAAMMGFFFSSCVGLKELIPADTDGMVTIQQFDEIGLN